MDRGAAFGATSRGIGRNKSEVVGWNQGCGALVIGFVE
jgi:hypothetical protein